MLRILGKATSINVRKVLWVCAELRIAYELEPWGVGHLTTNAPEFLALNPNALVPVLVEESFVLWESNTICRYLASGYGGDGLYPIDRRSRARVEQWMDWQATELNNSWRYAFMSLVRKDARYPDPQAVAASAEQWNRNMRILDRQLESTGAFATGATFTLADVVLGLATHRWFMTPIERPELAAITQYYERLSCRPGFVEHGRNGIA